MKVLIFRTGGNVVNISSYNLQEIGMARALHKEGIECDVLYYGGNKPTTEELLTYPDCTIRVIWARGFSVAGNGIFPFVSKILKQYDVIQVSEYDQLFTRYVAFFSRYKNRACLMHGPYYNESNYKYNLKIKLMDRIWIPTQRKESIWCFAKSVYAQEFLNIRGFNKVVTTGIGLDFERFEGHESITPDEKINKIAEFKDKNKLLLYIGQISDRRSIMFLIDVIAEMKKTNKNIKMVLVGNGEEGYKSACLQHIKDLKLEDNILYIESITQEQIPLLYNMANIFLLPSKYEIFGMVMLEAMYFRVPVITTDHGGSISVIENNINGFVLPLNIPLWSKKIEELISNDLLRETVGDNSKRTIITYNSWDYIVNKMIPIYEKITSEK